METQYRLLIIVLGIFLSISLASAITISTPSQVNLGENFDLVILGSGFYALEMKIPQGLSIISDPSVGTRTGDIYKTVTTGSLTIILRGIQSGTYTISGQFTDGSGIKDLNSQIIIIKEQEVIPICPTCPVDSVWSNCEEGKQIKIIYICSSSTNYQCVQTTETLDCQVEPIVDSDGEIVTCEVGWICKDENNLAYQSSDCSLSSVQECSEGCENKECKVKQEIKDKYPEENLTIDIDPPSIQETPQSFFAKVGSLIRRIIDFLIFWD